VTQAAPPGRGAGSGVAAEGTAGREVDRVSVSLPEGWWLLPMEPGPRHDMVSGLMGRLRAEDPSGRLALAVEDLSRRAAAAGAVRCAQGMLEGGTGRRRAANVLLAVRPGSGGPGDGAGGAAPPYLDAEAERLATADPGAQPRLDVVFLPMAGPAARLSWRPVVPSGGGQRARCAQYWVPFPKDDRTAVLTCTSMPAVRDVSSVGAVGGALPEMVAGGAEAGRVAAAFDSLAATLAFVDADGAVVVPPPAARR
jgi:hypothetical protein